MKRGPLAATANVLLVVLYIMRDKDSTTHMYCLSKKSRVLKVFPTFIVKSFMPVVKLFNRFELSTTTR